MTDMERRNFEESFKKAFQEAEVQPSDNVWTNVELDLSKAEGEKMKRRVLFYQMLAAASISFAILVTGFSFYVMNDRSSEQLALADGNDKNALTQDANTNQDEITDANSNSQRAELKLILPCAACTVIFICGKF